MKRCLYRDVLLSMYPLSHLDLGLSLVDSGNVGQKIDDSGRVADYRKKAQVRKRPERR